MAHQSLYRTYRPQRFDDVVGQSHVTRTLRNAVAEGARRARVPVHGPARHRQDHDRAHPRQGARLREGPDAGLRRHVRELPRDRRGAPPGRLRARRGVAHRRRRRPRRDHHQGELRGARAAAGRSTSSTRSTCCRPRRSTRCSRRSRSRRRTRVFVLCTTHPHKVPETIHSRCQRFDFRRIGVEDIVERLQLHRRRREASRSRPARSRSSRKHAARRDARRHLHARPARRVHRQVDLARRRRGPARRGRLARCCSRSPTLVARRDVAECFRFVAAARRGGRRHPRVREGADRPLPRPVRRRRRRATRRGIVDTTDEDLGAARRAGRARSAATGSRACSTCSASSPARCAGRPTRGSRSRSRSCGWRARRAT